MTKDSKHIVRNIFLIIFVPLGILYSIVLIWLFIPGPVDLKYAQEFLSPDGSKKAVLYTASWGGAAGGMTHSVTILGSADTLDVDAYRSDKTVFSKRCCDSVDVKWQSDSTLSVRYINEDEDCVYKKTAGTSGVKVEYEPRAMPRDSSRKLHLLSP